MQSKQHETVYIDSNIWFSYITKGKYDRQPEKAQNLIDVIINNKNSTVVISHLVLLEIINSLRRKIPEREKYTVKLREDSRIESRLKNTIENYIRDILDKITRWEDSGKLLIVDVRKSMTDIFRQAFLIQSGIFGYFGDSQQCMICRSPYPSYYYKTIDHWDIQHALIAKEGKVTHFDTFDKGFYKIQERFKDSFAIRVH